MTDIGFGTESTAPAATIIDQVKAAEAGGAATFWLASHLFLRDPIATAALALAATVAHQGRPDGDQPLRHASRCTPRWRPAPSTRCSRGG